MPAMYARRPRSNGGQAHRSRRECQRRLVHTLEQCPRACPRASCVGADREVVTGQTLGYVRAPAAWSACQTLAAVRGVSMWRTPQGANASMTALATAAGAARVG